MLWNERPANHPHLRFVRDAKQFVSLRGSAQQDFAHHAASGGNYDARLAPEFRVCTLFLSSRDEAGVVNRDLERRARMKRLFQTGKLRVRMDENGIEVAVCAVAGKLIMMMVA